MIYCDFKCYTPEFLNTEIPILISPQGRLGAGEEELEHRDGWCEVPGRRLPEGDDGVGSLVDHHLGLVPQHRLEEVKEAAVSTGLVLLDEPSHNADLVEGLSLSIISKRIK